MSVKLKKCPFCGGEAAKCELSGFHPKPYKFWVECMNEDCLTKTGDYSTEKSAIDEWNKRADDWIPVDERLPEEPNSFLCQVKHTHDTGPSSWIEVLWYNDRSKEFEPHKGSDTTRNGEQVAAWKPLPEPYKKQKES